MRGRNLFNYIFQKLKCKRGISDTLLAFIIVSPFIIYIFLLTGSWKLRDVQYQYIDNAVKTTLQMATKKGKINTALHGFLVNKVEKLYNTGEYKITYGKQDFENLDSDNIATFTDLLSTHNKYKAGDVLYIQFEITDPDREPIYSKLLKILPFSNSNTSSNFDRMLIVHVGMVEVNVP